MKTYTHLLFDLDRTLFDFDAAEEWALEETCRRYGIPYNDTVLETYSHINKSYWELFEKGLVTQTELAISRFKDLFKVLHVNANYEEANRCYRQHLAKSTHIFPEAVSICEALSKSYTLCFITNGITDVQLGRLSHSPLKTFASDIFISEAVGYQKPKKEFFDYVYEKLQISPSQALVIGDSLTSDISGAQNAVTDSCWLNPSGNANPYLDIHPTYEIRTLTELLSLLSTD